MLEHVSGQVIGAATNSVCSLPPTKPRPAGVWSLLELPEAGKPAAGWGRAGEGGGAMRHHRRQSAGPPPLTPPHKGEGNTPSPSTKTERAAQGRPLLKSRWPMWISSYPRRLRCPADCIMIAATLKQTAAAAANVKSEIHMERFPSFWFSASPRSLSSGQTTPVAATRSGNFVPIQVYLYLSDKKYALAVGFPPDGRGRLRLLTSPKRCASIPAAARPFFLSSPFPVLTEYPC
jgi:hypothetical protein